MKAQSVYEKIIPFDKKNIFVLIEDPDVKFEHPISGYFLKVSDLSVNALISLKWIE